MKPAVEKAPCYAWPIGTAGANVGRGTMMVRWLCESLQLCQARVHQPVFSVSWGELNTGLGWIKAGTLKEWSWIRSVRLTREPSRKAGSKLLPRPTGQETQQLAQCRALSVSLVPTWNLETPKSRKLFQCLTRKEPQCPWFFPLVEMCVK